MKSIYSIKCFVITIIMHYSTCIFAGYTQRLELNVIRLGNTSDEQTEQVCFKTTDFFDIEHCGNNASNTYYHGPKHWKLNQAALSRAGTIPYTTDSSCVNFFNKWSTTYSYNGLYIINVAMERVYMGNNKYINHFSKCTVATFP